MATSTSIEATRSKVFERSSTLTTTTAKRLFETPFSATLNQLDAETKAVLFQTAKEEVEGLITGPKAAEATLSWPAVFNTYAQLVGLVKLIRKEHESFEEESLTELGQQVFSAQNRISTMFYILRTEKELTEAQGRSVIEAAFPLAIRGLSEEARAEIFSYVYERSSGVSWGQVAEDYSNLIELVVKVKPSTVGRMKDADE